MPSGYKSAGVDLDDLFDPDLVGDGPAAPALKNAGVPLRYASLSYGTKRADVGYRQNGVDVSNLWAAKGTAVYAPASLHADTTMRPDNNLAYVALFVLTDGRMRGDVYEDGAVTPTFWNYAPTSAGASAAYDFRCSGTFTAIRDGGTSGIGSGKNIPNFTAATVPGNSQAFDSGWITAADDVNYFVRLQTMSPSGNGAAILQCNPVTIQVRRKSDGVVVRTFGVSISSTSDGGA